MFFSDTVLRILLLCNDQIGDGLRNYSGIKALEVAIVRYGKAMNGGPH